MEFGRHDDILALAAHCLLALTRDLVGLVCLLGVLRYVAGALLRVVRMRDAPGIVLLGGRRNFLQRRLVVLFTDAGMVLDGKLRLVAALSKILRLGRQDRRS